MIVVISKCAGFTYGKLVKPILFKFSADSVHEAMIRTGNFLQKVAILRWLLHLTLAYRNPSLTQKIHGLDFSNPIGLSAGIDKDAKLVGMLEAVGFGFVECGSVTYGKYGGNPRPWYTRLAATKSIIVNSGLRSEGACAVIGRSLHYKQSLLNKFPLNISIAKTNSPATSTYEAGVADYISSLKLWEKVGNAKMYTINISCPNTFGGEPFTKPEDLEGLLIEVDKLKIRKPLFIKFPIDKSWKETHELLEVCNKHSVQGITLGNLYKDRSTVQLSESFDNSLKGNFSGKPCWERSNELLKKAYKEYGERFVFSGVGGVFTAEDAYTKIRLGASLVEMATGVIFGGPSVAGEINRGLVQLLKRDGFSHISEAIGVDNR
jgi:dihydroorotate dehydrogenase (fumarate)